MSFLDYYVLIGLAFAIALMYTFWEGSIRRNLKVEVDHVIAVVLIFILNILLWPLYIYYLSSKGQDRFFEIIFKDK